MKRLAFIFGLSLAGIAAALSIIIFVLGGMDLGLDKDSATVNFLFGVYMLFAAFPTTFMRAVGIPEGHWWAYIIGVVVNALLGFFIGALAGIIVGVIKKCVTKNELSA